MHLRSYLFSLLATCLFIAYGNAQNLQPLTEIPTELGQQARAYAFTDEAGVTLLFQESGQARIFLLGPDMQLRQSYTLTDLPQDPDLQPLGFTNRPGALHFYYLSPGQDQYQVYSISKRDGASARYNIDLRERKTYLHAGAFTYQGTLHIVRMPRSSNVIRVCKFEDGGQFTTEEIQLQRADFGEKVDYQLSTIHPDSAIELIHTWQAGKMYQYGPFLYLTLDEAGQTYVVEVNLADGVQSERSFAAPDLGTFGSAYKSNSLLWQDLLIQFAASTDSMKVQIRDLRSGGIMSQYAYGKQEKVLISSGPLLHQGLDGQTRTLDDTQSFIEQCAAAPSVAIAAHSLPDSLLIFVAGSVSPVRERGVSGIVLSERYETSWFEVRLDLLSLSPVLPLASSPRWQRRQAQLPQQVIFSYGAQTFRGYYDPRSRTYKIR